MITELRPARHSIANQRLHLLPNPAQFSLNNVKFAVSSIDVLFHLRKEEFLKRGAEVDSIPPLSGDDTGTDAMANTCRHLLQQRKYVNPYSFPDRTKKILAQLLPYIPCTPGRITGSQLECDSLGCTQVGG